MNLIIVGGGASGVICAIAAKKANPKLKVTILEQNDRLLKKVLKTGNGKCNIGNTNITSAYYNDFTLLENNLFDVCAYLTNIGILQKEMTLGRLYPYSESAKTVINVLLRNLEDYKVEVITNCEVVSISKNQRFQLLCKSNAKETIKMNSDFVVISTGSCAQERTNGYTILETLGHHITDLSPGLVPIITKEDTKSLQGIRWKCALSSVNLNGNFLTGEVLFRSDGLSGIVTLDISRYIKANDKLWLDLMPEYSKENLFDYFKQKVLQEALEGIFPKMLYLDILKRVKDKNDLNSIINTIKKYEFTVLKKRDFDEAQIVLGGVDNKEVNSDFSSKFIEKLYLTGEVLNVDGASGGYNLFFAFLSGIIAGKTIGKKAEEN